MKFQVDSIDHFEKEAKRLIKKIPSLKGEISDLIDKLEVNPNLGVPIGNGFFKIRIAIRSKGKGKRSGARIITFVKIVDELVFLVSIYDKSDKTDISDAELKSLLDQLTKDKR